jgi:fructokinase
MTPSAPRTPASCFSLPVRRSKWACSNRLKSSVPSRQTSLSTSPCSNRNVHRSATVGRPLVFGEALFDEFADGSARLGGAPLNVAWHLRGFGLDPLLVTRVGEDAHGGLALERMRAALLDTRGVHVDATPPDGPRKRALGRRRGAAIRAAGRAGVRLHRSRLALPRERFEILYHGSLAARNEQSADVLCSVRDLGLPTFIDVNLRAAVVGTRRDSSA